MAAKLRKRLLAPFAVAANQHHGKIPLRHAGRDGLPNGSVCPRHDSDPRVPVHDLQA